MAAGHGRTGRPWRRLRAQVLAGNPVCAICGIRPATTVDHIQPLTDHPELAHVRSNLRPACTSCNSRGGAHITNARKRRSNVTSLRW